MDMYWGLMVDEQSMWSCDVLLLATMNSCNQLDAAPVAVASALQ